MPIDDENAGADAKVPDEKPRLQFRRETTSSTIERVKPKMPAPMLTAHSEAGLLSSSIAIELDCVVAPRLDACGARAWRLSRRRRERPLGGPGLAGAVGGAAAAGPST